MTKRPQKSKTGSIRQQRLIHNVRLEARIVAEAIEEIKTKGLKNLHEQNALRKNIKSRSLKLASHLLGLATLSPEDQIFFGPTLKSPRQEAVTI